MKRTTLMVAGALLAAGLLAGCDHASEKKTPAEVRREVRDWDSRKIQKAVEDYAKAIGKKTDDLEKKTRKVRDLTLEELAGDQGRRLQKDVEEITRSISRLRANMDACIEVLQSKL